MANPKMQRLSDWIAADPTSRGYDVMTDNEVATDMVEVEFVPAETVTAWRVFDQIHIPEVVALWDGDVSDRARINSIFQFLGGGVGDTIPEDSLLNTKSLFQRAFGSQSQTSANVDALLDGDVMSRAAWLGFAGESIASMTDRVGKARAL